MAFVVAAYPAPLEGSMDGAPPPLPSRTAVERVVLRCARRGRLLTGIRAEAEIVS